MVVRSLAEYTRSTLVFRGSAGPVGRDRQSPTRASWPWLADDSYLTTVTVTITPRGYGSLVTVRGWPVDRPTRPRVLDAYGECLQGWGEGAVEHAPSSTTRSTFAATTSARPTPLEGDGAT